MSKKIIHSVIIIDKSSSMMPHWAVTIAGINSNVEALKKEQSETVEIINTQMQFSGQRYCGNDFKFTNVGTPINAVESTTEQTYRPNGGTPLFDAIGAAVERVREFHGDNIDNPDLSIIVTIYTDGEENESATWTKEKVRKMIDHYQSEGKWTFTFVGCGDVKSVQSTSAGIGIAAGRTMAYADTSEDRTRSFSTVNTSYTKYISAVTTNGDTTNLF